MIELGLFGAEASGEVVVGHGPGLPCSAVAGAMFSGGAVALDDEIVHHH